VTGGAHRGGVEYIELNGQTLEGLTRSEEFAEHLVPPQDDLARNRG